MENHGANSIMKAVRCSWKLWKLPFFPTNLNHQVSHKQETCWWNRTPVLIWSVWQSKEMEMWQRLMDPLVNKELSLKMNQWRMNMDVDQCGVLLGGEIARSANPPVLFACSPSCPTHLSLFLWGFLSIPPCPVQLLPSCLRPVSSPPLLLHSTSSLPVLWKFTASYKVTLDTHTHTMKTKSSLLWF